MLPQSRHHLGIKRLNTIINYSGSKDLSIQRMQREEQTKYMNLEEKIITP